jgi:hypothetical protein
MMMTDELKKKVVVALKDYEKKQKTTRKKTADAGGMSIVGNGNVQVNGDVHVNSRRIERPSIQRGPQDITEEQAFKLYELVKKAVEIESIAGGDKRKLFASWWSKLKRRFKSTSYKQIPYERGEEAISYMQQAVAQLRPKLRRRDNEAWRKAHYTGIWSRARELGHPKSWVYELVEQRLGKKVDSLTALGEQDLKKIYTIIIALK